MGDSLTELYTAAISEEEGALHLAILNGGCADFAEYRYKCGVLRGLQTARAVINEELSKVAKLQDDD